MQSYTKAIVLSKTKYSDSSYIVKTYTELYGIKSFIISVGNNRASKSKRALLSPLSCVELSIIAKENKQLARITDIKPFIVFKTIPFDIEKTTISLFIAELLQKTIKEEEKNNSLFNFLNSAIIVLEKKELNVGQFHFDFIISLTSFLGLAPKIELPLKKYLCIEDGDLVNHKTNNKSYFSPEQTEYIALVLNSVFSGDSPKKITKQEKDAFLSKLIYYLSCHLNVDIKLKSKDVLKSVFS